MTQRIKVLFLSLWYPHEEDEMEGLFVQKHAKSVGELCNVKVLYAKEASDSTKKFVIKQKQNGHIDEIQTIYPKANNKLKRGFNYYLALYKGYRFLMKNDFRPDIIHANVLTRVVFFAYLINKIYKIPYLITEHWSIYLDKNKSFTNLFDKIITKKTVKNASYVLPVSTILKKSMINNGLQNSNYKVIQNAVDNFFFEQHPVEKREKKKILHISCFDENSKNISGILRAIKQVSQYRSDFELNLIGKGPDLEKIKQLTGDLNLDEIVKFIGELTPNEVASQLYNCDFMLLFSNYETAAVVISECLACGKPLISTPVGIASEFINKNNGLITPIGDENTLAKNINFMLDNFEQYNAENIKKEASKHFTFQNIGLEIFETYKEILKHQRKE